MASGDDDLVWRIRSDLADGYDEELELELEDRHLDQMDGSAVETDDAAYGLAGKHCFHALFEMQVELVKLQDWVVKTGYKVVILIEGRDAAGKGGVIKRITQRLNPRLCRVAALPAPIDRERTHIAEAPWWVAQAVEKKMARLNCIHHLLGQIPYTVVEHVPIELPPRVRHDDYVRHPVPAEIMVPQRY